MTVGCGPSRQLVLKMGEPLPGGCSGGKQGWGCWTQSLGSAPTRVLTPLMLGTASSAPSCQAGSQHLAMAQGIANSLRASGSSVTGTDGELEGWVMCVTPLCDLNKVSLVCILGTRYTFNNSGHHLLLFLPFNPHQSPVGGWLFRRGN